MEKIDCGQPFAVIVDYAHTEAALAGLLEFLRELTSGSVRLVFGCGGERDKGKRYGMGRLAAESAEALFLTSDNPRGEDPEEILAEIERGTAVVPGGADRSTTIASRREAIHAAIKGAGEGDVVLIAGKGHEATQTFSDRVEPFDDRLVARRVLESLGWRGRQHAGA
jgi:UDP-N-acetylmuramoyl-L-alanyl-D-glutamate--2,6-diaminopimelate ligase